MNEHINSALTPHLTLLSSNHPDPASDLTTWTICDYELSLDPDGPHSILHLPAPNPPVMLDPMVDPNSATKIPVNTELLSSHSEFFATAFSPRWNTAGENGLSLPFVNPETDLLAMHVFIHINHSCSWRLCPFLRRVLMGLYNRDG